MTDEIDNILAIAHSRRSTDLLKQNAGPGGTSEGLMLAIRHAMCGWIMEQATEEQLLEITDKYKRAQFN